MKKLATVAFSLSLAALWAAPASAQMPQPAEMEAVTIQGTVVDMSCKLVYDMSGVEMHRECAQVCADRGIPLGILADDGTFYLPVTAAMPGTGVNERLRGHAEHRVTVTGKRFERGGMNAIVIDDISMQ